MTVSDEVASVLERLVDGRASDDFVLTTPTGRPVHEPTSTNVSGYPLMAELRREGIAPFRFHDFGTPT